MAYSDAYRLEELKGVAITTASADLIVVTARRPFRVLGFGIGTVGPFTAGTGAVGGTIELQHAVAGGSFTTKDSLALPNANHALGTTWEKSELLRGRSGISSPEGALTGFDVNPGDVVRLRVTTAQVAGTGGSAGSYTPYLILAPKGGAL